MKTYSLFLTLCLLILATAHAFGQSRFGEETRLTDIIVKVQSGTLELPDSRHEVPFHEARINVREITHVLTRYGATDILRSFPDANPADTLMFNEFGQPIRLINRSLVYRFRFPERTDLGRAAEDLSKIHEIVFASAIPEYQLDVIVEDPGFSLIRRPPNDTHYAGRQWNLHHTGQGSQPPITDGGRADMRARDAWNLFTGSNSTRIGIIDTGTSLTHEDLSGKVIGDPHTGNHGTHVGGIAAAITDNHLGISGVDWHAELISGNFSSWMPEDAYDTILSSVSLGAQILNNSWSFLLGQHPLDDPMTRWAFTIAHNSNVLPIATTGNTEIEQFRYPSSWPEVMAVGSNDYRNHRSSFSTFGSQVEVVAPGGSAEAPYPIIYDYRDIYAPLGSSNNSSYGYLAGTSMAAPHVSGLASLIRGYAMQQHNGIKLYNDDLRQIINRTTDKIRPEFYDYNSDGWNLEVGYGRINAHKALLMVRDNSIFHIPSFKGYIHSSSNTYAVPILAVPGLSPGLYIVRRHEVRRDIYYPQSNTDFHVWARSVNGTGITGWADNPTFGRKWTEVVPGSISSQNATLRTYLYEIWNASGQYLGWWPTNPHGVTFPFTWVGNSNIGTSISIEDFQTMDDWGDVQATPHPGIPETFGIESLYPNPATVSASMRVALPEASAVTLVVYDVLGREISRSDEGSLSAGYHEFQLNTSNWPNGVYLYRVEATSTESGQRFYQTHRMTVAR